MSDFFWPPPAPHHDAFPEWYEPPEREIGVPVGYQATLARTDELALVVRRVIAYSDGFEFILAYRTRTARYNYHWGRFGPDSWESAGADHLPDELFRIGVQFDDGRTATSLEHLGSFRPVGPAFRMRHGHGGRLWWDGCYWVGSMSPAGSITLVWEWPVAGLQIGRLELPARELREASLRSETG
ncbi:MAG: hypothetical protein QOG02_780 [Gaiellales bacterium]|jgi:hypothetical protein|nr:hypothetical protein [Gaiellales bacterium]MDX6545006.1 hypothetical protein [Gaiellales bacterium]